MLYDADEALKKKREFAAYFLKSPQDPYAAALATDPRPQYAIWITNTWQFDAEVQSFMKELRDEHKSAATIPTKEEFAALLISDAQKCRNSSDRLDYYKLFGSVMGYIEKPAGTVVNNNTVVDNRKVIALPSAPTIDDWETQAEIQQMKLINGTP